MITNPQKFIKIYDINHNILAELTEYNTLIHDFLLNGMGKCSFNVPMNSIKCTQLNFQPFNIIEIWNSINCVWWGVIAFAVPVGSVLNVSCYDYTYLLQKTTAIGETITNKTIQVVMANEVANFNKASGRVAPTIRPILIQHNIDANTSMFASVTYNDDNCYSRLTTICTSFNYDFNVDVNFCFNYYSYMGANKSKYSINYGTKHDNVTTDPTYSQDTSSMANAITYNGAVLVQNIPSQNIYGIIGAPTTVSPTTGETQADILNAVNAEQQRLAFPSVGIQCNIIDSNLCPFSDMFIGDSVTVNFPAYWGFNQPMRIIELDFDDMACLCTVTLGNIVYKPAKPQQKIYAI